MIRRVGGFEKVGHRSCNSNDAQILSADKETIPFHVLPELVGRFLTHPDPIVIPYTIRVDKEANFHTQCFDIPVEIEDPVKSKMAGILQGYEGEEGKEIVELEDRVSELAYFARDMKQKRDFLEAFA